MSAILISVPVICRMFIYWVVDTGEGIQAKRRSAACLISYLSAPLSISGVYDELAELEKALEEYVHFKADKDADLSEPMAQIREKAAAATLQTRYVRRMLPILTICRSSAHISDGFEEYADDTGLHIMGNPPQGEKLTEYLYALVRLENPDMPSLPKTLAQAYGYDYYELIDNSSKLLPDGILSYGMLLDKINGQCLEIIRLLQITILLLMKQNCVRWNACSVWMRLCSRILSKLPVLFAISCTRAWRILPGSAVIVSARCSLNISSRVPAVRLQVAAPKFCQPDAIFTALTSSCCLHL